MFDPSKFTAPKAKPLPVFLLLDVSGSMNEVVDPENARRTGQTFENDGQTWELVDGGTSKIQILNDAVRRMVDSFAAEERMETEFLVSIITFGDRVVQHLAPGAASSVNWTDTRRSAFNFLFSGYNDPIHHGLLSSALFSMAFAGDFDEIVYFNGRGVAPGGGFAAAARALGARFKAFDEIAALPLQGICDGIGSRRFALIIDGLDSEKALHPSPAFRAPKPNEPPSPADLLKRIAEEGPRKGTFVFGFVDRWQRCASACKELFSFFELRVAFCMNDDDAGALVSGGIGRFKGIEKPNRAVFVNRMTNDIAWFRPHIQGGVR